MVKERLTLSVRPLKPARRERISWRSLLIEVGVIVFSVLLALGVDEWRDSRQEKREVAVALQTIRGEIDINQRMLRDRIPYYSRMEQTLNRMVAEKGKTAPISEVPEWKGLRPVFLSEAAYQAAISTQAFSHMDFEVATALSRLYTFQELYESLLDKSMTRMMGPDPMTLGDLNLMFGELTTFSRELESGYSMVIQRLESRSPDS